MDAAGARATPATLGTHLALLTNLAARGALAGAGAGAGGAAAAGRGALARARGAGVALDTQAYNACLRLCARAAGAGGGAALADGQGLLEEMRRGACPRLRAAAGLARRRGPGEVQG